MASFESADGSCPMTVCGLSNDCTDPWGLVLSLTDSRSPLIVEVPWGLCFGSTDSSTQCTDVDLGLSFAELLLCTQTCQFPHI